jgi:hypothetical protein
MHGGDCECCRDVSSSIVCHVTNECNTILIQYYVAVGPLPNRLRQPRWRSASPVSQREMSGDLTTAVGNVTEGDIAMHREKISRHRYIWERAKTPPGYWNIGFPTTQEAVGINAEAQEMHRNKRKAIEMESEYVHCPPFVVFTFTEEHVFRMPHGRYVKR